MTLVCALVTLSPLAAWEPLFDGKTLKGWTQINGTAKYRVEDNCIVGSTVLNSPNSFLCTTKDYGNFELEFECLVDNEVNSGVQIRSNSIPGYQDGRVHGYQVEIDPTGRGFSGGLYEEARRGWLQDLSKNEKARKAFKNGKWNHFRVVANDSHIQTWVNKVAAADFKDDLTRWGFIGLQVHNSDKVGREVRWRNLRIKDLGIPTASPPKGGKWLLRNTTDIKNWTSERNPKAGCPWKFVDGSLITGGGDITTVDSYGDCVLHVEFMTDDNGKEGQDNGNSGVYLMRSYEVQVLNSAPRAPAHNECGGIYSVKAPDYAMARKAGEWQSYDITFTAPVWRNSLKLRNATLTVHHNGTRIHDRVGLPNETGAGIPEAPGKRQIRLQDHGNNVRYRNIWIAPLSN